MSLSSLSRRGLLAAVCAAPLAAQASALLAQDADPRPAVFLIGDSIIRNDYDDNGGTNLQWGWGHMMKWRFNTTRIHVVNDAYGGTSSRSFMESPNFWPKVKRMIRPGDFVLIGFGHNDPRGSLPGNSDETGFLPSPPPRPAPPPAANSAQPAAPPPRPVAAPVAVHSFGWYLREYVRQVRALGANHIILSLIPRNRWVDGKIVVLSTARGSSAVQAAEVPQGFSGFAHARATGKLLLALADQGTRDAYLKQGSLAPVTARTITESKILADQLRTIAQQRYSVDEEEFSLGLCCLAVPFDGFDGQVALGISVPTDRFHANFGSYLEALRRIARMVDE